MTADIINLRQARKNKGRAGREAKAAENRARFGRTKLAKEKDRTEREKAIRLVEDHRREPPDERD